MQERYTLLTALAVPSLFQEQLAEFTTDSIHQVPIAPFDAIQATKILQSKEGYKVIGADFGGDKGLTQLFVIRDGKLVLDDSYSDYVQSSLGDGYLASLEKTAQYANENNIPVGISWGGPINGSHPVFHPKVAHFLAELDEKYDGDIANVLSTMKPAMSLNDGSAGLISGIMEANQSQPTTSVLFPINGGGLGMAALANQQLYATEAGHVTGVQELNKYGQTEACGVFEATHVCIERLGANKAGIEAQWQTRNEYLRARDIEDRYKAGDTFAGELYDHSALAVAHMIQGTANVFGIDLSNPQTAIVGHGGAFKFPYYGERVLQILTKHNGSEPRLIMTKDYGDKQSNACLDGAALAAAIHS